MLNKIYVFHTQKALSPKEKGISLTKIQTYDILVNSWWKWKVIVLDLNQPKRNACYDNELHPGKSRHQST